MTDFTMPSLGADMEAGTLVAWLVAPGDRVTKGDAVAVVETQKGAIEIETYDAGEVVALLAQVGETLPVGAVMARIAGQGEGASVAVLPQAEAPPAEKPQSVIPAVAPPALDAPPPLAPMPGAPAASPAARVRAGAAGVDLAAITGTGPGGAVLLADVERSLTSGSAGPPQAAPTGKPGLDMAAMRRAIAAAMTRSKREIPHYYLWHEIDLQAAQDRLTAWNAAQPPDARLLMGALLLHATVQALARVPELNGHFREGAYLPADPVHCGLVVALRGGGLIAPAILDAQDKSPATLMAAMRDLVARTRTGLLRQSEITQGTITVSSLGEGGVDALAGVIYPPQVALVGFGTPRLRPMIHAGTVQPRLSVTVTLAADHRVSDGRRGALFLSEIDRLLQQMEIA